MYTTARSADSVTHTAEFLAPSTMATMKTSRYRFSYFVGTLTISASELGYSVALDSAKFLVEFVPQTLLLSLVHRYKILYYNSIIICEINLIFRSLFVSSLHGELLTVFVRAWRLRVDHPSVQLSPPRLLLFFASIHFDLRPSVAPGVRCKAIQS